MQLRRRQRACPAIHRFALFSRGSFAHAFAKLRHSDAVGQFHCRAEQRQRLYPQRKLRRHQIEQRRAVTGQQRGKQPALDAAVRKPQHVAHLRGSDKARPVHVGVCNRLIENRQPVAHRTFRSRGEHLQRLAVSFNRFGFADLRKVCGQHWRGNPAQVKTLAAR